MSSSAKDTVRSVLLVAAALVLTLCGACFEAFEIMGPSTEPGLLNGDRVIALRNLRMLGDLSIEAGDMVIVQSPLDGNMIAKRVVGMPGDVFEIRDSKVYIDGKPLPSSDAGSCTLGFGAREASCRVADVTLGGHLYQTSIARPVPDIAPVEVPEGSYFILGDHLDASNDSRNPAMGPVPFAAIHAEILGTYLSADRQAVR